MPATFPTVPVRQYLTNSSPLLWRFLVILAAVLLMPWFGCLGNAEGAECAKDPLPCVIRVLAEQKTNGEDMVRLFHAYLRDDVSKEAKGIKLYSAARSAFEGVIEELKSDLDRAHSPANASELNATVQSAVKRNEAFASYVDDILPKQGGVRGPLDIGSILEGGGKLLKSLVDGGIAIWDKFHESGNEEKERIRTQLDQLKWKPYGEIAG